VAKPKENYFDFVTIDGKKFKEFIEIARLLIQRDIINHNKDD